MTEPMNWRERLREQVQERFERWEDSLNAQAQRSWLVRYLLLPLFLQLWFYSMTLLGPLGLVVLGFGGLYLLMQLVQAL